MRRLKLSFSVALALSALTLAGPSFAQAEEPSSTTTEDGYFYGFKDDALLGGTLSTTDAQIKVRKKAARVTLIRPRASFVAEMLKSVELM
jgi:hypothetical protein